MLNLIKVNIKKILYPYLILFLRFSKSWEVDNRVGICTLLCHRDVQMFLYNISSFFFATERVFPIYIIDDGTLTNYDKILLKKKLNAEIESSVSAEVKVIKELAKFPYILKFRCDKNTHQLKKKLDVLLLNPFNKFIYLDADLLFYKKPEEIIKWIDSENKIGLYSAHNKYPLNFYNNQLEIITHAYRYLLFQDFNPKINPSFNSGLLCLYRNSFDLRKINNVFKIFYISSFINHKLAEEIALGLGILSQRVDILPTKKYLNVWDYDEYIGTVSSSKVSVHFSLFDKKDLYIQESVKLILETYLKFSKKFFV